MECVFCFDIYLTENITLFCKTQMVNWQLNLLIALQLMFNKINDLETSGLLAIVLSILEHRDDTPLETVL